VTPRSSRTGSRRGLYSASTLTFTFTFLGEILIVEEILGVAQHYTDEQNEDIKPQAERHKKANK